MQKTKLKKKEKELELVQSPTDEEILAPDPKEEESLKVLVGYHPITGVEVWQ
jgi:hypothetical protein